MHTMRDILELAGRIMEPKLRRMVSEILRNPGPLTNKGMNLSQAPFNQAPASMDWHHAKNGGLLEHTYFVTKVCMSIGEQVRETYGTKVDTDALIAGALLHDIGKVWGVRKSKSGKWHSEGSSIDHTMLGTSELHARHFPEKVVHIVAAHFGDQGPTPPQTLEAFILHTVDNMDAVMNENVEEQKVVRLILG